MNFIRGEISFDLPNSRLEESGFIPFSQKEPHYKFDRASSTDVFLVQIEKVSPPTRAEDIPLFNSGEVDGRALTAREGTVSILKAIAHGTALPPVKVIDLPSSGTYRYKLVAGMHRFLCSIVAGYSHVPAMYGIDINDPYL
jgi:uncharacterized ferritin-like protein (DUF455 family)